MPGTVCLEAGNLILGAGRALNPKPQTLNPKPAPAEQCTDVMAESRTRGRVGCNPDAEDFTRNETVAKLPCSLTRMMRGSIYPVLLTYLVKKG